MQSSKSILRAPSGSGWYKNEKTYDWNPKDSGRVKTMTYSVSGYFKWCNGDVSVTNPAGMVTGVPSNMTVSNRETTSGTGRYGFIFNKYAYVKFSFTCTNFVGTKSDFDVTIKVSENGNVG